MRFKNRPISLLLAKCIIVSRLFFTVSSNINVLPILLYKSFFVFVSIDFNAGFANLFATAFFYIAFLYSVITLLLVFFWVMLFGLTLD